MLRRNDALQSVYTPSVGSPAIYCRGRLDKLPVNVQSSPTIVFRYCDVPVFLRLVERYGAGYMLLSPRRLKDHCVVKSLIQKELPVYFNPLLARPPCQVKELGVLRGGPKDFK